MKTISFALIFLATAALVLSGCVEKAISPVTPNDKTSSSVLGLHKGVIAGQLIAFASNRGSGGNFNIYLMQSNGDKVTQLTFGADAIEYYGRPDWSPDRKKMTLTTVLYADGLMGQIYTMDANGSNLSRLPTPGNAEASRWSPDGTKIVFGMYYEDTYQVYVMGSDGLNMKRVTNDAAYAYNPAWAPDSRRIIYTSGTDGQLHVINTDGTGDYCLTSDPRWAENPAWSPLDNMIAFVSYRDNPTDVWDNLEIYVMNVDGSGLKRLTSNTILDAQPGWSPDGSHIVFVSTRDGNFELYTMSAEGTGVKRVTDNAAFDADAVWAVGAVEFK